MKEDPTEFRQDLVSKDAQDAFDQLHAAAKELDEESVPMPEDLKADLVQHWDQPNNVVSIGAHRSRPWVLPLAAAAAVVLLAVIVIRGPSDGPSSMANVQGTAKPSGYVVVNRGDASLERSGDTYEITTSAPLAPGDQLVLEQGDQATVQLADGSTQNLTGPQTYGVPDTSPAAEGTSWTALFGHTSTLASLWLGTTRAAGAVSLHCPVNRTAFANPPILLGQGNTDRLDLHIVDEDGTTQFVGALEPNQTWLPFESLTPQAPETGNALEAGAIYDLVVVQGNEEIERTPFLVTANATTQDWAVTPAEILLTAVARVSSTPAVYGDALALLSQLPNDQQSDALVQRLRLLAFSAMNLKTEFDADLNELTTP